MEPINSLPTPEDRLPKPLAEGVETRNQQQEIAPVHVSEKQAGAVERPGGASAPVAHLQVPATPQNGHQTHSNTPLLSTPPSVGSISSLAADDADLIEKEWVDRAKNIIAQTGHDPHVQNQEIGKIKADYIKKRYNKDIKVHGT